MPSDFEISSIPLSEVSLENQPFRITTDKDLSDITRSIKRVGLINPPVVISNGLSELVIVCGRRRIKAAMALGWEHIPARVLPKETNGLFCALLSISENITERSLNQLEISRAVSILMDHEPSREKSGALAQSLGLPHTTSIVNKIRPLCRLPEPLQGGIVSGSLSLPTALMLSKFPEDIALLVGEFIIKLRLSLHKQREMIGLLEEIVINEDTSYRDILDAEQISGIMEDPDLDMPRKAGMIRSYIKKRRFPNLSEAQDTFEHLKGSLKIGDNASLNPPPGFESNRYTFSFTFSSISELKNQAEILNRLSENDDLVSFLSQRDI
jgi:ParB family chromosome partitioning protein